MTREETLSSSRELVNQIYTKMGIIESCDTVAEKVKDLDVCFNDADKNSLIVLHEVLSAEQMAGIREGVISAIYDNAKDAQAFLEQLNKLEPIATVPAKEEWVKPGLLEMDQEDVKPRKAATINEDFEKAVKEMEAQTVVASTPMETPPAERMELTYDLVKELYHDKDMTMEQIAAHTGVPRASVYTFINKNGLRKPSKRDKEVFRDSQVVANKKPR